MYVIMSTCVCVCVCVFVCVYLQLRKRLYSALIIKKCESPFHARQYCEVQLLIQQMS